MPSLFETTFNDKVMPTVESLFGVAVTFARGPLTSDSITARRNDVVHKAMGLKYGVEVKVTMRDYLLPIASVVLDGDAIEPRKGDRITEGTEVFEIQPPDNNTPAVEKPAGGYDWLVHTKRIE